MIAVVVMPSGHPHPRFPYRPGDHLSISRMDVGGLLFVGHPALTIVSIGRNQAAAL